MRYLAILLLLASSAVYAGPETVRYGTAYTVTFRLLAADGTLLTGETDGGTDSTCGLDGATGSTCTNDYAEIEKGLYKITLTLAETTGATVQLYINATVDEAKVLVTCGNASAKWPQCPGEADVKKVNGTTISGSGTAGSPWGPT